MKAVARALSALVLAAVAAGCGYTHESSLDPQYQTIHVAAFYDQSREYDLQAPLTNAVIRKFITDSRLRVVDTAEADLLLEGVITNYRLKGLTFDANDNASQYLLVISAGVRVTDQLSGKVLWEEQVMSGETSFFTQAAGQTADRLRGNAETFLPAVRSFPSEEENRAASEALEQLASDIFYRTVEPWPLEKQ